MLPDEILLLGEAAQNSRTDFGTDDPTRAREVKRAEAFLFERIKAVEIAVMEQVAKAFCAAMASSTSADAAV